MYTITTKQQCIDKNTFILKYNHNSTRSKNFVVVLRITEDVMGHQFTIP